MEGKTFTQMQLQKLVYIAHGWNLAINGTPLTHDSPQAWDYGPVYKSLWAALRQYGRNPVSREILNEDYDIGAFADDPTAPAVAKLSEKERSVVERVLRDYGQFHAFKLSALTHQPGTPWSSVFKEGEGKFNDISPEMIRQHFVELATNGQRAAINH